MIVRFNILRHLIYLKLIACKEPIDQYLRTFNWNKVKYRADKPIIELIDSLRKVCEDWIRMITTDDVQELFSIDSDVKSKIAQYNQVKTNLTSLQRKQM